MKDTYIWEDVKDTKQGDVFSLHGKKYQLIKKTTTAIAVRRWFWWNELFKRLSET